MSFFKRAALSFTLVAAVACGSNDPGASSSSNDAGADAPADHYVAPPDSGGQPDAAKDAGPFAPAAHDAAPKVMSAGGSVVKHPLIVPVFFPNDTMQPQIEDFLNQLAASTYWGEVTSEYGVGALTIAPSVVTNTTPPTSSSAIDQWLKQLVKTATTPPPPDAGAAGAGGAGGAAGTGGAGGAAGSAGAPGDGGLADGAAGATGAAGAAGATGAGGASSDAGSDAAAPFPAPTPDTIYAIFMPQGVTISDAQVGTSCKDYGGYHTETYGNGGTSGVAYAIMPRCKHFSQLSGIDAVTAPTSHELVEAATDPHPVHNPAFAYVDDPHAVWNIQPAGELGDMCVYEPQSFAYSVGQYAVQRTWSNASAAAGHDPCVPNLNTPYFNAVPDQPDDVVLKQYGYSAQTRGVKMAVGETRTIDVHLFSDMPRSSWIVQAQDAAAATGGSPTLSLLLDKNIGNNGDVFHLTITRNAAGPIGGSEFMLWSQDQATGYAHVWFGYVGD